MPRAMAYAPADRALELLAEPLARGLARELADAPATQAELVARLKAKQSTVSRSLKELRLAGLVESDASRGPVRLRCQEEVVALLLAADRLAERVVAEDAAAQRVASARTRRTAIRPAGTGQDGSADIA